MVQQMFCQYAVWRDGKDRLRKEERMWKTKTEKDGRVTQMTKQYDACALYSMKIVS